MVDSINQHPDDAISESTAKQASGLHNGRKDALQFLIQLYLVK